MLTEKLRYSSPKSLPLDEEVYTIRWKQIGADEPPDVSHLPSIDHALYLFNTVKFHLGQNYRFLDENTFVNNIQEFYFGDAVAKASIYRLWFIQFLLVLSFGKAFLPRPGYSKDPPGSKYFTRAMSLMPDQTSLWKESLLAVEVLALAGLYLYSIDYRISAHVYVGTAFLPASIRTPVSLVFLSPSLSLLLSANKGDSRWARQSASRSSKAYTPNYQRIS